MRQVRLRVVVSSCVCLLFCAHIATGQNTGLPFTRLFDTKSPAASALSSSVVAARTGWTKIVEDDTTHQFQGDAVVVNNRIALVVRKLGSGVEVYVDGRDGWHDRAAVSPKFIDGEDKRTLTSLQIVENTLAGVRLDCQYRVQTGLVTIGYRLIPGDPGLQIDRGTRLGGIRVAADIRYAVVPNYFGDDLAFSAKMTDTRELPLPTEQLLLAMLDDGDAIMMCVCESNRQENRLVLAGTEPMRRIAAVDIETMEDKRIWIAFMADQGIWSLRHGYSSRESFGWTPPFAARWRLAMLRGDGRTISTLYGSEAVSANVMTSLVLVYPLERNRETPLTKLCVTDIMRNTLGVGPCQYIIAAEDLNSDTPHEVTDWIRKQFERKRDTRSAKTIRSRLDQMTEHIRQSQAHIEAYRRMALQLLAMCEAETSRGRSDSDTVTQIRRMARMLEQHILIRDTELQRTGYGQDFATLIVGLIGKPEAASALETPIRELCRIGAAQDKTLANCRLTWKWLKIQRGDLLKRSPQAAVFLRRVGECLEETKKE